MHLKNWSTIYPGDGCIPALAPIYDVLSSIPYLPKDQMALSLGGEKPFKTLTPAVWRKFSNRARLPEKAVLSAVEEVVSSANEHWWNLPERDVVPAPVLERIDNHIRTMSGVLDPS
jgi:serine/threonine-protein kinase HipA